MRSKMRWAPARPMTTMLTWLDTWLMAPANCLVMFRKGTTMLMLKAMPRDAQVGRACQQQRAAHQRHQHIQHVADVAQHAASGCWHSGWPLRGIPEQSSSLTLSKSALALLLVAEHLDDLLAVHHLLDEALSPAQGDLLAEEIPGRAAADLADEQASCSTTPATTTSVSQHGCSTP